MTDPARAALIAHAHPWDDPCTEACPAHRAASPRLGPERPFMDLTCGRLIGAGHCGKPATWHFAWDDDIENGLCCDDHATEAREQGWGADWHPITEVCTMPDTKWVGSQYDPPGRCEWEISDGTRVRAEAAVLAQGAPDA